MDFSPLKKWMDETVAKGVPGCELIVCREHEVLFHECAGYSDREKQKKTCPSDRYFLYSCTKPVTVTAAMQLIEKGDLELDAPVARYLPGYENLFRMEDGKKIPVSKPMTVRHLFTMTGGFNYDVERPALQSLKAADPNADTIAFARALAEGGLDFEPGEKFQYSLCHDVLAAVVEKVSGQSLAEYMQAHIFAPLGMENTEFYVPGRTYENLAAQYMFDGKNVQLHPAVNRLVITGRHYSGGAGLISTASDYARFADSMACDEKLLKRGSIDRLRREELKEFRISGNFTCTCHEEYGYGLGVRTRIANETGAASCVGEFGWDGAAGADILIDPEHGVSFAYVQHVLGWPGLQGTVHLQIRDLLYPILGL